VPESDWCVAASRRDPTRNSTSDRPSCASSGPGWSAGVDSERGVRSVRPGSLDRSLDLLSTRAADVPSPLPPVPRDGPAGFAGERRQQPFLRPTRPGAPGSPAGGRPRPLQPACRPSRPGRLVDVGLDSPHRVR
jgi:hypothetical protein